MTRFGDRMWKEREREELSITRGLSNGKFGTDADVRQTSRGRGVGVQEAAGPEF